MRITATTFIAFLLATNIIAQSPQKMSYQAVIRNSSDQLVNNQAIGMRISILQGSETGTPVYVETQTPTTNTNGLVSIGIGGGTPVTGTFAGIDWSTGTYFIKTETDPNGGSSYTITATSQLLSVPYALYSKIAGSIKGHYIGELFGGGVIFWIDQTGQHGLISSMINLSTSQEWSNNESTLIGTTAQSSWDGLSNSNAIISQSGHTGSAAKLCLDYTNADYGTGVYSDWYLPAIDQLLLLFNVAYQVEKTLESDGNVATTAFNRQDQGYWSSSEVNDGMAYYGNPNQGGQDWGKIFEFYVRAVRSF